MGTIFENYSLGLIPRSRTNKPQQTIKNGRIAYIPFKTSLIIYIFQIKT